MIDYMQKNLLALDIHYLNISSAHLSYRNCIATNNAEWAEKHLDSIESILLEILPHGSGIDAKWEIEISETLPKIVFRNSFHRMNDLGYYVGWFDFSFEIDSSAEQLRIKKLTAKGLDRDTRDYLEDSIYQAFQDLYSVFLCKLAASRYPELLALAIDAIETDRKDLFSDVHVEKCSDGISEIWGLRKGSDTPEIILIVQ